MNAETDIRNVLAVGIDVVSLAISANRAGYQVYAVDYFGDQDLKKLCYESRSIINQRVTESCGRLGRDFNHKTLLRLVREISKEHKIDAALLASGLDDFLDVLLELDESIPILGNRPDIIKNVRNKTTFFQELSHLGVPRPETAIVEDFEEAERKSKDIGYPVVVKPSRGFGGVGIRKARNTQELKQAYENASLFSDEVLIQEHISGTSASISIVSSAKGVAPLTLNEQLLGMREMHQYEPFGYCGNIVPLATPRTVVDTCEDITEKITSHFGLVGSNGIDLVISKEGIPYVIEVNPRFQGTLECVERVLGINLVESHIKACIYGTLPKVSRTPSVFCTRLILFASQQSIMPSLSTLDEVRDIPLPGVLVEQGEPVCSIVTERLNRDSSLKKARSIAKLIHNSLKPCS